MEGVLMAAFWLPWMRSAAACVGLGKLGMLKREDSRDMDGLGR